MRTNKERTTKRDEFVMAHIREIRIMRFAPKIRSALIEKAREQLAYSPKTSDRDIENSLIQSFKNYKKLFTI